MDLSFFLNFLIHPPEIVWTGMLVTISISIFAQTVGVILGLLIALARGSRFFVVRALAAFYVWAWRGTPLLVQLLLVYTGVAAAGIYTYPEIDLGAFVISGPMQAALLALSCNEGAYMSEIFRSALQTVSKGQIDAARALGLHRFLAFRLIVLPQAMRVVIPPLGNEFTLMIKGTSLVSIIGVREFFGTLQDINSATFKTFELFLFAAIWYLILTSIFGLIQSRVELRMSRHEIAVTERRGLMRTR